MKIALDIVGRQYDWCSVTGRWVVVATRILRANPEERFRSDMVWRPTR